MSFCIFIVGQNTKIDSLLWDNGEVTVELINYKDSTVYIQHFDSLGRINEELNYKIVDSIKCFQSKEHIKPKLFIYLTHGYFSDTSVHAAIKVGDWKFYNEGKLDRIVNYLPLAYQYATVNCNHTYVDSQRVLPCSGGEMIDFLIEKIKYFDENTDIIRVDNYRNGILSSTWNYKANK
jgi:hypothetical protein